MASSKSKSLKDNDSKVFDVAKPGKSTPSATARPIIISNRPILKDPMMSDETAPTGVPATDTAAPSQPSAKITVKPITVTDDVQAEKSEEPAAGPIDGVNDSLPSEPKVAPESTAGTDTTEESSKPETPAAGTDEQKPAEPAAATTEQEAKEAKPAVEPEMTEATAETAATDESKTADKSDKSQTKPMTPEEQEAAAKEAAEKAAEHTAAIQKLVDSKEYFLPINSVEKRKTKRFVLLGVVLIVVLGLAWVDVALDAGLIHAGGLKAATHFFQQ